jgi:hypothetical protein
MDALLIVKQGDDWYAAVSNTLIKYKFAGDLERQEASIQAMATCMADSKTDDWDVFFDDVNDPEVATNLLGSSNEIWLGDAAEPIFTASEGETALTEIVRAGELLLEALG